MQSWSCKKEKEHGRHLDDRFRVVPHSNGRLQGVCVMEDKAVELVYPYSEETWPQSYTEVRGDRVYTYARSPHEPYVYTLWTIHKIGEVEERPWKA
jgi:hypothetical protein